MGAELTGSKQSQRGTLSKADIQSISQPRRQSNSSLSAFQTLARGSDVELSHEVAAPQTSNRPYIIATIALLFGVVAVLAFLLLL